jgi:hypothetical protein
MRKNQHKVQRDWRQGHYMGPTPGSMVDPTFHPMGPILTFSASTKLS